MRTNDSTQIQHQLSGIVGHHIVYTYDNGWTYAAVVAAVVRPFRRARPVTCPQPRRAGRSAPRLD
jgi:hypothetical protein